MSHSPEILEAAARLNVRPEAVEEYLDAGRGKVVPEHPRSMHTTIKAIGSACNLDCTYCYYLSKEKLLDHDPARRLADEQLERFIVDYLQGQDAKEVAFTWHGGEPTLLGLRFFRRVVELQQKHLPPGRTISNDLQTNGTLLDDEWCAFLREHGFLVGISLDGPEALHDAYRPTKKGRPSFPDVMNGVRLLQKHGITFSTLTTVNRRNAKEPLAVYRFLRDEVKTRNIQFIPCVEPKVFETTAPGALPDRACVPATSPRGRPGHPLSVVTDWSVEPEDWGTFLAAVFDEWHALDQGHVVINLFESMFAQLDGQPSLMCTSSPVCGKNVALEHDGRVYSCDHFVYPEHELGTLGKKSLGEMVFSLKQLEFGLNKHNSLPRECRECSYLKLCWGECPRTRLHRTRAGEGNLSYLCAGWKGFFAHVVPRAERVTATRKVILASSLVRRDKTT